MTFEEAIARLEEIVQGLEAGGEDLEASLTLFEEGVGLAKTCEQILQQAEGKIEQLLSTAGEEAGDGIP